MNHENDEHAKLLELLDAWRPEPLAAPDFERRLRERIAAAEASRPHGWRRWWQSWRLALRHDMVSWRPQPLGGLAALALVVVVAGVWWRGGAAPERPAAAVETATLSPNPDPMLRDLQVMDHYGDLLDNLDFLSQAGGN